MFKKLLGERAAVIKFKGQNFLITQNYYFRTDSDPLVDCLILLLIF